MKSSSSQHIGLAVALDEEVQDRVLGLGAAAVPALDRGGAAVLGLEHAELAHGLDPLVVAVGGLAVVGDAALPALRGAQEDHGRVVLAQLAHLRRDQGVGEGRDLDRLLAQEEAGEVEIVDGHVAQQAARDLHVGDGRDLGVAAGDDHLAQVADLAGADRLLDGVEGGVEAAVEADLDRHAQAADLAPAGIDLGDVEVDRLLAQDGLAGLGRGRDQLDMGVGRGRDQHGIDAAVAQRLAHRAGDPAAMRLGHRHRRRALDVERPGQLGLGVRRQIVGMHPADAAAAQNREPDHAQPPTFGARRAERLRGVKRSRALARSRP